MYRKCKKPNKSSLFFNKTGFTLAELMVASLLVLLIAVNSWKIFGITISYVREGLVKMLLLGEASSTLMHMRYRISVATDFNSTTNEVHGCIEPYNMNLTLGYEPDGNSLANDTGNYEFRYYLNGTSLEFTTEDPNEINETLTSNVDNLTVSFDTFNKITIKLKLKKSMGLITEIVEMRTSCVSQCKNNHYPPHDFRIEE